MLIESAGEQPTAPMNEHATNLIINFLPLDFKEARLRALFEEVGPITSVRIMKNRKTAKSKGYGFVKYVGHEDAREAIQRFNGMSIQGKNIKVAFSRPGGTRTHCNLFVSNLPKKWTNDELSKHFEAFGSLLECRVLKNFNGESRRCGFVRFDAAIDAQRALKHMDGYLPKNARSSINVKLAERPSHDRRKYEGKNGEAVWVGGPGPNLEGYYFGAGGEEIYPQHAEFMPGKPQKDMTRMNRFSSVPPSTMMPPHAGAPHVGSPHVGVIPPHTTVQPPHLPPQPHAANANSMSRMSQGHMFMNPHLYSRGVTMTPPPMYLQTSLSPAPTFHTGPGSLNFPLMDPALSAYGIAGTAPTPDAFQTPPIPSGVNFNPGEPFDGPLARFQNSIENMSIHLSTPSPPPPPSQTRLHNSHQNMRMHMKNASMHEPAAVQPALLTPEVPEHVAIPSTQGHQNMRMHMENSNILAAPFTPETAKHGVPSTQAGVGKDTIFISNLPAMFDEKAIKAICLPYGSIKMVTLQRDNRGASLGMAFVSFVDPRHAELAVHRLNGSVMYNSKVMVRL